MSGWFCSCSYKVSSVDAHVCLQVLDVAASSDI